VSKVGRGWLRGGVFSDEALRGQSSSRRYSQARIQNTAVEARGVSSIDICRDAFGAGLVAGAEARLKKLERGRTQRC
jgi:hypothetical protein